MATNRFSEHGADRVGSKNASYGQRLRTFCVAQEVEAVEPRPEPIVSDDRCKLHAVELRLCLVVCSRLDDSEAVTL